MASNLNGPFGRIIKPRDKLHQGRFGRACPSQNSDRLAGLNMQCDAGERVFLRVLMVFERDILKIDAPIRNLFSGVLRGGQQNRFIQHFADTVRAGQGARKQQKHIGNHHQRVHNLHHITQEPGEIAHL